MRLQSIVSKLGEVRYRAKIAKQHLGKEIVFPHEPTAKEFESVLVPKLKDTKKIFTDLKAKGVNFTPYLEIGTEYGLRASLLESKFKATGIAADLSLYSLEQASKFTKKFKFAKVPKTICADAYNLPFKSNSFPFIFIYETLHHFPDPMPVLLEIKRVLAPGGQLFVGSDPIKPKIQLRLWRRPSKLRFWEKILKLTLILPFISHIGKTEVDHGIIEEAFPLRVWQQALSIFKEVEVKIKATPLEFTENIKKTNRKDWLIPSLKIRILLGLFGGAIEAFCQKSNIDYNLAFKNLDDLLICPNCLYQHKVEIKLDKNSKLNFLCKKCKSNYKKQHGVLVLLEKRLEKAIVKAT